MKKRMISVIALMGAVIIGINVYQECFGLFSKYKKMKNEKQQEEDASESTLVPLEDTDPFVQLEDIQDLKGTTIADPNKQVYSNLDFQELIKQAKHYEATKDNNKFKKSLSEAQYQKLIHTQDAYAKNRSLKQIQSEMLNFLGLECLLWACKRIDDVLGTNSSLNESKVAQKVNYILTKKLKNITSMNDRETVQLAIPYCIYPFAQAVINQTFPDDSESFGKMGKKSLLKQQLVEQKAMLDRELAVLNIHYQEIRKAVKALGGKWELPNNATRTEIVSFFK